jgi:chitodextrinase
MSTKARVWHGLGALTIGGAMLFAAAPSAMAAPRDTTPPTAPSNLHAVSITDTDIVLEWNASTDNSGSVNYAVFFDDNPTPFLTSATTRLDVELNRGIGMIPGSTHTFQVRAEDPSGNDSFSNKLTVSFAPGDNTPPTAPSNLHVTSITADGVQLAWNPSTDDSDFIYFVDGTPCGPLQVSGSATQVLIPSVSRDPVCGLVPGSTDTFSVRARDAFDNDSASSNSVTVTLAP